MNANVRVTDITPQIELQTGAVVAPGNAIIARGKFFRISQQSGAVIPDDIGPIRAFLADSPTATSPSRPGFTATCTAARIDGRWAIAFLPDTLSHATLRGAFDESKVAYLIIEQGTVTRTHVKLTYAASKSAVVR